MKPNNLAFSPQLLSVGVGLTFGLVSTLILIHVFSMTTASKATINNKSLLISKIENRIEAEISKKGLADSQQIKSSITELLSHAPLNDNALIYAQANFGLSETPTETNPEIFKVVMSRNPRNRRNLYALIDYAIKAGDLVTVLKTIELLYRIDEENREGLLNIVNTIYSTNEGQQMVDNFLLRNPSWEQHFLYTQAQNLKDENLNAVANSMRRSVISSEKVSVRVKPIRLILYALIDSGDTKKAHEIWRLATEKVEFEKGVSILQAYDNLNYNPKFLKIESPAPFNWEFNKVKNAVVEPDTRGLYISVEGSTDKVLASQYFIPTKGAIELDVSADYSHNSDMGKFVISMSCLNPQIKGQSFEVALEGKEKNGERLRGNFSGFEPDCSLAQIEIRSRPGTLKNRYSATISSVEVKSVGN